MAKIRPFNESDKRYLTGPVTGVVGGIEYAGEKSVVSPALCGYKVKAGYNNSSLYNSSPYITLDIPVLNPFIAGKEARVLSTILGKQVDVVGIAKGELLYDTETNRFLRLNEIDVDTLYTENILIGGEILEHFISNLDVEEEIGSILEETVAKSLKDMGFTIKSIEDIWNFGEFEEDEGVLIIDRYCFVPKDFVDAEVLAQKILNRVTQLVDTYHSRLSYLLHLRESKQVLFDMLLRTVPVLPLGYRQKFMGREDKLTTAYDNLYRRSAELSRLLARPNLQLNTLRIVYTDIVKGVKNIMTEKENMYDKDYKPLLDQLKGKKGLIRDKMQGVRMDYSGRSVIISDPNMSFDSVGIPISMLEALLEVDVLKQYKSSIKNKSQALRYGKRELRRMLARKVAQNNYIMIGRQPTLYNLGLRCFKIVPTDGAAIVLNPLSTPAFNADFDGDQMHAEAIIGLIAKKEAELLLGAVHNVFLPRNGECHIAPRQEIIHGLWKASTVNPDDYKTSKYVTAASYNELLNKVVEGEIKIYDKINISGVEESVGKAVIRACFSAKLRGVRLGVTPITFDKNVPEKPVKEGFFKELNKYIAINYKEDFVSTVNKTVRLGFAVTNMFAPSMSIVKPPSTEQLMAEFEEKIREREKLYNMGFETDEAFSTFYSSAYRELEDKMKKHIKSQLGSTDGFIEMMESKARGSVSNLLQVFGMKGRVKKNEAEAFNVIMKHSHVQQLDALEHGVTAYGGREGLIDKSIETYGPGYFSRKLSHVTSPLSITNEDCGDTEGLLLEYDFLKQFVSENCTGDDLIDNTYVKAMMLSILVGKYLVGEEYMIETKEEASLMYDKYIASIDGSEFKPKMGIRLRSPITCKNPCCVKCYGLSMSTNAMAIVGEPVGALASGAIGEPGTQLIMKNFQLGGVAGVTNLTSSFGLTEEYTHLYDKHKPGVPIDYDYISPVEGKVQTVSQGNGTKLVRIMGPNANGKLINKLGNTKVIVYEDAKLKDYVTVGETISKRVGYKNIREVLKHLGVDYAKKYLALILFNIYRKEAFVSFKHFEVLVSQMSFKLCIRGNDYFKPGVYYMMQEYYSHDSEDCYFVDTIKGIAKVPHYRKDVFSTIFLEDIQTGLGRSLVLSGEDEMKLPITRYSFGLRLQFGSAVPGYLEKRGSY
ncbi:MAG: hypothetical protein IJE43_19165 [Alphaproteobacteria bacterium]|nr:hypothetical protein [Alphaproteobacteria bacterium]